MTDQCSLVGNQTRSLILCGVVMCPVCLVGIWGNVACAVNVLRKQLKQSVIYYCFMALCISDIGTLFSAVIIIVLPRILKLLSVPNTYTLGLLLTYGTILFYPICMTFQMASSWLMVVMSATRCLSVISPLKAKSRLSSENMKLAILCTYVATALYNLPRWCELKTGYCYSTENVNMGKDSDRYNHVAKNLTGKSSLEGVGSNITQSQLHIKNISGETEVKSSSTNATLNMMIPVVRPTELRLNVMYVGIYSTIFYSIFVFLAPFLLIGGCNFVTALVLIRQRRHRQTNLVTNLSRSTSLNSRINSLPSPDGRRSTRFSRMASSRRTSCRSSTDIATTRYLLQASPVIGELLTRRPTLQNQGTGLNGNETANLKQFLSTKRIPASDGQHLQNRCANGFNESILDRNIIISDPTSRKRTVCSFNLRENCSLLPRNNSIVGMSKVLAEPLLEPPFDDRQTKTILSFSKSPIDIIADDEPNLEDKIPNITPGISGHIVRSNSKGSLKCFDGSQINLRTSVADFNSCRINSPRLLHRDYLHSDSASFYSSRTLSCASVLGGISPMGGRRNGINYDRRTDSVSFSATLLNVITISFMICNVIPNVASIFEVYYNDNIKLVNTLTDVGNFLICFNAASNFIIFYLFKSSVRSRISSLFQRSEYVPHNASVMVDY